MTTDLDLGLADVAQRLRNSTVRVIDVRGNGAGSGIVWPGNDLIVTNAHVIRGRSALVETGDGRRFRAAVVRRDPQRDLAALQIGDESGLEPVAIRDAEELRPGELVLAVGNPLGLTGALSTGLVQRCNARWVVADVKLAPGNSGGPLADAAGLVVGVNSMVARGLALAIPSEAVEVFLGRRRFAA